MRKIAAAVLTVVVALGLFNAAYSGDDKARAVVAKAIAAMGGENNLMKHQASTWNEKGTYYGMGDGLPYTGKYAVQWPGQFRMEIEGVFTMVIDGDKGWMKMGDSTSELPKDMMAVQIKARKASWVTTLLPLADKAFELSTLGEVEVEKQPAIGVKVSRKDYPDVKLYFDKKTNLLIKSEFRIPSPEQGFKEVTQEAYYSDFREVDGAQIPRKIVIKQDGKRFVEAENTDMKAHGKLDAKYFAKP